MRIAPTLYLGDATMDAVRHKASQSIDWTKVVLVLDATSAPQHALAAVVEFFKKKHGARAPNAGFKEIWLVGPDSATTYCLSDARPAADLATQG